MQLYSSFAHTIEISTVAGCKVDCTYCPQHSFLHSYRTRKHSNRARHLSPDDLRFALDSVPSWVDIHFSGFSEPLLNANFPSLLNIAISHGHKISLFTTLVGATPNMIDAIKSSTLQRIVLHLPDSSGGMKCTVDDKYVATLDSLLESELDLEMSVFGTIHPKLKHLESKVTQSCRVVNRAGNLSADKLVKLGFATVQRKKVSATPLRCRRDRVFKNVMLPNADLVLCCMDYSLQHCIGNLLSQTYPSIFSGEVFRALIQNLTDGGLGTICSSCEYAVEGLYTLKITGNCISIT